MGVVSDFKWSWRGVVVKETGNYVPFNLSLVWDIWRGGGYIIAEWLRPPAKPALTTLKCIPRQPRPWYLIWGALRQAGIKTTESPADHALYFQDQTYLPPDQNTQPGLNAACADISKTRVAEAFERVFGYALTVDPMIDAPPFVAKSEINGAHDGYIATDNEPPKPGWVYQKLVDNRSADNHVADIRCPTVFGEIPLIFIKERPENQRFANLNTKCRIEAPKDWLTDQERTLVSQFCQEMGLDWGGLDILRDKEDQRIYIVDVNKTDMGPPLALPLRHKLRATKILGQALRTAMEARLS